jgi:4-hydroxy-2-oxoheptanedioate aldolase
MKDKLTANEAVFGLMITWANPGCIEAIGGKYDFCLIDAQHGLWGFNDLISGIRACELVGTQAIVRVCDDSPGRISRILDLGAAGIMVPMINTPDQAEALAKVAHFPPRGERSFGGRRVIWRQDD